MAISSGKWYQIQSTSTQEPSLFPLLRLFVDQLQEQSPCVSLKLLQISLACTVQNSLVSCLLEYESINITQDSLFKREYKEGGDQLVILNLTKTKDHHCNIIPLECYR